MNGVNSRTRFQRRGAIRAACCPPWVWPDRVSAIPRHRRGKQRRIMRRQHHRRVRPDVVDRGDVAASGIAHGQAGKSLAAHRGAVLQPGAREQPDLALLLERQQPDAVEPALEDPLRRRESLNRSCVSVDRHRREPIPE